MTKYQNMKIEINEQQPLDEVVRELEKMGYNVLPHHGGNITNVVTKSNCLAFLVNDFNIPLFFKPTTLPQLKAMEK